VFGSAFVSAVGGGVVVASGTGRHALVLTFLGLVAMGYARLELDLVSMSTAPA
jgi:hypothetical protein